MNSVQVNLFKGVDCEVEWRRLKKKTAQVFILLGAFVLAVLATFLHIVLTAYRMIRTPALLFSSFIPMTEYFLDQLHRI